MIEHSYAILMREDPSAPSCKLSFAATPGELPIVADGPCVDKLPTENALEIPQVEAMRSASHALRSWLIVDNTERTPADQRITR
ncbi:MAG: hypothetical protein OHK0046_48450 [Anaerolineae bacterium]